MTSAEIRQSFLDFFRERQHTIVPSASLLPDSPGLLFTNAGMNQFVPIFLNEQKPDVSEWAGAVPDSDTRAADTQKCIRAGGKHNDLEDVGWDTYHHTFFEMLGNWSFGDYFKRESLTWGWRLLTEVWGIPAKRLFATVYTPDKSKGDPADFDQEAYDIWAEIFRGAGLDPDVHIINGNRKDNFWMMGDTGPCGPCSEIHFNLMPDDDELAGRKLVNAGSPRCIEIWNHVFIQFNAGADGSFSPLPSRHVDTGMGFERVAGIHGGTKGFTDFTAEPSNYDADIFTDIFARLSELTDGKHTYKATVPAKREQISEQERIDVAFRVVADHARCVCCAIADGIIPGNSDRNYVIRRILRRGILYGRKDLGLETGFLEKLVPTVVASLGAVFPELREQHSTIERAIRSEEESFGRTLDRGIALFNAPHPFDFFLHLEPAYAKEGDTQKYSQNADSIDAWANTYPQHIESVFQALERSGISSPDGIELLRRRSGPVPLGRLVASLRDEPANASKFDRFLYELRSAISGYRAFELYDTYGFPLDMTQLLAAERGLTVDVAGFEAEMEKQRHRARAAQKKDVITVTEGSEGGGEPTKFIGYSLPDGGSMSGDVVDVVQSGSDTFLAFDQSPFYAEMGGQAGDTGTVTIDDKTFEIVDTIKDKTGRFLHQLAPSSTAVSADELRGEPALLHVDTARRRAISRHHSAVHLLHWALRKTLGTHVRQAGTSKTPDRARFDFSHFEQVKPDQLHEIERLVNERVIDNAKVEAYETDFDKIPEGTLAFFGDKYGKVVRVVDIGGYSRELCGGTHVSSTGEIGIVKIVAESAIAAGTRRLEIVAGKPALDLLARRDVALDAVGATLSAGPDDVASKLESLLVQKAELEKQLKSFRQKAEAGATGDLAAGATEKDGLKTVVARVEASDSNALRQLGAQILGKLGEGVVVLGAAFGAEKVSVVALCSPAAIKAGKNAGDIVRETCAKLGGKGGGKPDFAMGGGKDAAALDAALDALR